MNDSKYFIQLASESKLIVQINLDGSITLGENVDVDTASIKFYQMLSTQMMQCVLLQKNKLLEEEIKTLKQKVRNERNKKSD